MSESETVAATQRESSLLIRGAEPADHEAIRGVVLGAHASMPASSHPRSSRVTWPASSTWARTPVTGACS